MKKTFFFSLTALLLSSFLFSCKKDEHTPPTLVFKTGASYTSASATVGRNDTLLVGVTATKTEDELKTFNASYAYDGATTTTSFYNHPLLTAEEESYSIDLGIITRNLAGTERWVFTITDRDGNIKSVEFTLTVN